MRVWLFILMVAISIGSLSILRPTFRTFTPGFIRQHLNLYEQATRTIATISLTTTTNRPTVSETQTQIQTQAQTNRSNMTEAQAAMNPMPVLAKADPTGEAAAELPKLSAADFQTYNRLAVMMDYYVSICPKSFTLPCLCFCDTLTDLPDHSTTTSDTPGTCSTKLPAQDPAPRACPCAASSTPAYSSALTSRSTMRLRSKKSSRSWQHGCPSSRKGSS